MLPNKAYTLIELSADDSKQVCCECGNKAFYIVNNVFAVCEEHRWNNSL